jgi:dihydrofolate reductase
MRKIIVSEMISVDGFFAGPNGEIDWHNVDGDFNKFAIDQLRKADTLLFGRVTYELMANYWPTPAALKDDPVIAERMNNLPKIVFSKTLDNLAWNNSKLMKDISKEAIMKIKQAPGKDILLFGSGIIVSQFADLGLIDEYRLFVNPIVLGKGKTIFKDINGRIKLKLLSTKEFDSGNVLLCYQPSGGV